MNIPRYKLQQLTVRLRRKRDGRVLLYRNYSRCIIISGIYFRSSKPRLIFAFVPPICRAEVGSKIKVCRPYYLSGERNRARPVAQRSKSTLRVFALFSFSNSILLRFIGLLRRISLCRVRVARKFILYTIEYRVSSLPPSPQKKFLPISRTE